MDNCINPKKLTIKPKQLTSKVKKIPVKESYKQVVPCGKCPLCLRTKQLSWYMRVEQEIKYSEYPNHLFLTLTYNEQKIPKRKGVRTLYKRHPQLFFKRLRKAGHKVKYILVGEYGTKTARPHYHAILWTTAKPQAIDKAWTYGHVHHGHLTKASIFYALKYILNPRTGDNEAKQREYAVFSKGIGLGYLTEAMYNYHTKDYENPRFTTIFQGKEVPLPRYYRQKIFTKYQIRANAERQYYASLRKRFNDYRKLKERGYKNPWYDRKRRIRDKAIKINRQQKVKTNLEQL